MNAKLIKTTGEVIEITPENGPDFKLAQLYALLECDTIEVIYLKHGTSDDDLIMIGDEEGRMVDSPEINAEATHIYREAWNIGEPYDIVGNVILCQSKMLK